MKRETRVISAAKGSSKDPILARFEKLPVAVVGDAMDMLNIPSGILHPAIHRVSGTKMVGRARTIDRIPKPANATQADFDPTLGGGTYTVLDSSGPGTVVVIAAQGLDTVSLLGDNMATRCVSVGVEGYVADGAVRDIDSIREMGFTVFARALTPYSAKFGRVVTLAIDKPVVCGGVFIRPGDIVCGDGDGVVVVPQARAEEVLKEAERLELQEHQVHDFIAQGNTCIDANNKFRKV